MPERVKTTACAHLHATSRSSFGIDVSSGGGSSFRTALVNDRNWRPTLDRIVDTDRPRHEFTVSVVIKRWFLDISYLSGNVITYSDHVDCGHSTWYTSQKTITPRSSRPQLRRGPTMWPIPGSSSMLSAQIILLRGMETNCVPAFRRRSEKIPRIRESEPLMLIPLLKKMPFRPLHCLKDRAVRSSLSDFER